MTDPVRRINGLKLARGSPIEAHIAVIRLSEAFGQFWSDLSQDLGIALDVRELDDPRGLGSKTAALILSAGGAEQAALAWLDRRELPRDLPVFVVGSCSDRRIAAQTVGRGAKDYLALPDDLEILRNQLTVVVDGRRTCVRGTEDEGTHPDVLARIVGQSLRMRELMAMAAEVLPLERASVLIVGDRGTGKELLARALHDGGPRRSAPFMTVDCSTLAPHLAEGELFGYEHDPDSDSAVARPGLLEVADGGTVFFDQVSVLPLVVQEKLLRVIDDRELRRIGGTKNRPVDLRIIAATNRGLERAVQAGGFRQDLFYRLSVIVFPLPPLRERDLDVVLIAERLIAVAAKQHNITPPALTPEARARLLSHHWPGNVGELKNAIDRAVLLSRAGELDVQRLTPMVVHSCSAPDVLPVLPETCEGIPAAANAAAKNHSRAGGTV